MTISPMSRGKFSEKMIRKIRGMKFKSRLERLEFCVKWDISESSLHRILKGTTYKGVV